MGRKRKNCCVEGCTNFSKKNNVCIKHGAKVPRKLCAVENCNKQAQRGNVCIKHGAKVGHKRCSAKLYCICSKE